MTRTGYRKLECGLRPVPAYGCSTSMRATPEGIAAVPGMGNAEGRSPAPVLSLPKGRESEGVPQTLILPSSLYGAVAAGER